MVVHGGPLILVTNDDGVYSPGLCAALAALRPLGDLLAAAPLHQHSGAGRSFPNGSTGRIHPVTLEWDGDSLDAYGIEGSPAQSVAYALLELAPRLPDLAVVGINYGENVGNDVTSSGTVGAALEAASAGIPTLAVSLQTAPEYHYSHSPGIDFRVSGQWARVFAARLLAPDYQLPFDADLLNVNVPQDATLDTPWRVTRVSRCRYWASLPPQRENLTDSHPLDYRVGDGWPDLEPDSDIYALARDRVVSVSPISLDLSSRVDRLALERDLADRSFS
ncbi:MAG: 5'/3'-nucleotidase SurE [Anaerolineae bacterium]|nr:5'/3'-nucleotidase SurE [Anaerolineae bacterium]